ncbi:MAG: hypothetical protein ACKUBY_03950 [Candidatus Moraniibacteriota bacterium]|jgi:hypothetical protein
MDSNYNLRVKIDELKKIIHTSFCCKQGAWNKKDKGNWNKLWSAFDNIQDTQSAIEEYIEQKHPTKLSIYGILQALIVQQDSMVHLEESVDIEVPKFEDFSELKEIRNIRNETVGHPSETKKKRGKDISYGDGDITYTSLSTVENTNILEYQVWSHNDFVNKKVNIIEIIDKQSNVLSSEIDRIIKRINEIENKHKKKFNNDSLVSKLAQSGYLIQKLWSFECERIHSKTCFKMLISIYEEFKDGIRMRYNIEQLGEHRISIPGIVEEVKKVDELLKRIEKMVSMDENVDSFNLDIYVESLDNSFAELRNMAMEVDSEF